MKNELSVFLERTNQSVGRDYRPAPLGVPKPGQLVLVDFPSFRRRSLGRRPALIISPEWVNEDALSIVVAPISSKNRLFPFHVPIKTKTLGGAVKVGEIQAVPRNCIVRFIDDKVPPLTLQEVWDKLRDLTEPPDFFFTASDHQSQK